MNVIKLITFILMFAQVAECQNINKEKLSALSEAAKLTNTEGLLLYHNKKIILEEYYGIGHPDTLIETMSCTKSIVGLAAACLLDDGYLDSLSTPVHKFFPEWNQGNKKNITVEHLLSMTSGIQNHPNAGMEIYPSPDFVQLALTAELSELPGEKFRYNNKSLNLMSGIFLNATGKRMDKYIAERLFKPLGINSYNWTLDDSGNPHVMSGCQIKPKDFIKFGILLLNQGEYKGEQVITQQNINRVINPIEQFKGYGILWWLDYEGIKYEVDAEVINNLIEKGTDKEFIDKMELLKGNYTDYKSFENKIIEIFGENPWEYIQSNTSNLDEFRKKELTGLVTNYRADGYLGNYIIVVPEKNLIGVRMISYNSYNHEDKSGKDGFRNFKELLLELIE